MDIQEIRETYLWGLYEKGLNYNRRMRVVEDSDKNYRMYNGNQWEGAKLGGVEPVQKNFIKPIVKYKVSVIHDNLYSMNFSSQNYTNRAFRQNAERYCEMLNRYAANVWERDKMDFKGRRITKDAAINDEGIIYIDWDDEKKVPINEVIKKAEIFYGNENDDDIQAQPYILMRKRMPVANAIDLAVRMGVAESDLMFIRGDNDTFEESGEAAKEEVDNMVTVVYKMYKMKGTVYYSIATRYLDIVEDVDLGITLYPIAHFNWEEKEGSARGEGEVRYLIPNQIEVNRTEVRRVLTVKDQAYPKTVADITKIANPAALDTVGGVIKTNGAPVEDVNKIIGTLQPAMMSPDVVKLQEDLIQMSRDLAGAGDTATGQVDPESASGRAILAVQQASQAPMTEQKESYKNFIEDIARIWLEYLIAYSPDGIDMEAEVPDPMTGKTMVVMERVTQESLKQLQATVRIDITPKGVFDKFAQEQTLENLFVQGMFSVERLPEFEAYVEALDDDSVAPKQKLEGILQHMKEKQQQIAMINAQSQMLQQQAQQFLMGDPDMQAQQMVDAQMQLEAQMAAQEAEYAAQEEELDEETAEEEEAVDEE